MAVCLKDKGEIRENSTTNNESTVTAKDNLVIESGSDLNIIGSQVVGDKVDVTVGGNLNIETLQDTDNYHETNKSSSIGVNVDVKGIPSINGSKSKQEINSEYESNQEQAGIFAGDKGYDIYVEGNTDLKGGVISSKAEEDKNKLSTGTITFEDIDNKSEYKGTQTSTGFDTGPFKDGSDKDGFTSIGGNHITSGNSSGSVEGTTKSAVSEGTIEIRDTNSQVQDIGDLSRDTENANGKVDNIFDLDKVKEDLEFQEEFQKLVEQEVGKELLKDKSVLPVEEISGDNKNNISAEEARIINEALDANFPPELIKNLNPSLTNTEIQGIIDARHAYIEQFAGSGGDVIIISAGHSTSGITSSEYSIMYDTITHKSYRISSQSLGQSLFPIDGKIGVMKIYASDGSAVVDAKDREQALKDWSGSAHLAAGGYIEAGISQDGKYSFVSVGVITNVSWGAGGSYSNPKTFEEKRQDIEDSLHNRGGAVLD